jgi:transcriptional regulator with XRE-family HTH domain
MPSIGDERTGARIATYRKLRGLTQRGLALRANVAYSTLTKIESGHSMAQPAVVAAIARALSVNVTQLTGQPYINELRGRSSTSSSSSFASRSIPLISSQART